jgi:hypothetical protein
MFAFVVADKGPEDEGVMAARTPLGEWFPLVGADLARVDSLRPLADDIARVTGKPYRVVRFKLEGEIPKK